MHIDRARVDCCFLFLYLYRHALVRLTAFFLLAAGCFC